MKVSGIRNTLYFGRALTTKEKKEFEKIQTKARAELGLDKTAATIFDFSVPSTKNDTGIGTSFSRDAQELAGLLKTMCGVNSIQLQPQGQISNMVRSPYSGTSFSLGSHLIDLNKLGEKEYGSLLTAEDLSSPFMNRTTNDGVVDYNNVFAEDGQKAMLQKAYARFEKLSETSSLKKEFDKFKKDNSYWLEKDALYEAAIVANASGNMETWSERDKNIFATQEGDQPRIAELKLVTDEKGNNVVEFEEFVQFIADKQQKESKANFNKQGIEIYGDCQIGFSQKDFWAHKSAFYPTYQFGCDIGGGKHSCWSPALNFDKMDTEAGELLFNKFDLFFKRYDGVRIDAAWQLIKPLICDPLRSSDGKDVFDSNGNKLGKPLSKQPEVKNQGQYIMKDIILKAAKKNNVPKDRIMLELLGGNAYSSLDSVKNLGTTLIQITRYGGDNWGRVKYYESKGDSKYQNMKPEDYIIGPGTHDDPSLLELLESSKERAGYLSRDLRLNKNELEKSPEKLSQAVFAELFTTKNQFATLPDILGSKRRINTPNTSDGNWSYRTHQDYERRYYENLAKGRGLNFADALAKAVYAKCGDSKSALVSDLMRYAGILSQKGPMTTKEADALLK